MKRVVERRALGIIGCGRIGSAVALRAKALGMKVLFHDPYVPDGLDKSLGIERADCLDELLEQSYIISLHCPLTPETANIIGAQELASMSPGSFLVNTARGGVVDTAAVVDSIAENHLRGAGIDVLEEEPPSADSPVLAAWRDPEHRECLRAIRGEPLRNVVN